MLAPQDAFCRWLLPSRLRLWAAGSIAQINIQMVVDRFFSIPKIPLYRQFEDLVSVIYTISEAHVRRNVFGFHAKPRSWTYVTNLERVFLWNEAPAGSYCDCTPASWSIYTQKGKCPKLKYFWDRGCQR